MKFFRTLELLQGVDPIVALLLSLATLVPVAILLIIYRASVLTFITLMIGSCVALRWNSLNSIGLLGKYPLMLVLAIAGIRHKGRFRATWASKAYLFHCALIFVAIFNPLSTIPIGNAIFDGLVKVVSYLCCFYGLIVLTAKSCTNDREATHIMPWIIIWALFMIYIQFPFWSYFLGTRLTGIYEIPGTLQHSLARSIIVLVLILISRGRARWFIPFLVSTLVACGMLIMTGGRTAIGSVVLAMPFIIRLRPGRAIAIYLIAAVLGTIAMIKILPSTVGYEQTMAHLTSSESVRFQWWSTAWPEVMKSPIFGHGTNTSEQFAEWQFGHTLHNSYLDLSYDYGILYTALFISCYIMLLIRAWRMIRLAPTPVLKELAAFSGAYLIMLGLEGAFLSDLVRINLKWFLVCICIGIQEGIAMRIREADRLSPHITPLEPLSITWDGAPPRSTTASLT